MAKASNSRDTGESGDTCTSDDAVEHGFDLIVGGVSQGELACAELVGGFAEEVVPRVAQ